jgi:SAM-dependent methyltransferase/polysaccharide pyruvyl transferase WcaK-like protein
MKRNAVGSCDQTCPVCNHLVHQSKMIEGRDGKKIKIFFCSKCNHIFQDFQNFEDLYSCGKFTIIAREQSQSPSEEKIKSLDKKAFKRLRIYQPIFQSAGQCLEIGSAIGSFLHLLKLNGKKIKGIEPDPGYASFSLGQYGFRQENCLFEDYSTNKSFDIISSFHVIEHVDTPIRFVKKAHSLLRKNGCILIECPSWDLHSYGNLKHTIWKPHFHYFNSASLYYLLSICNFHVEKIAYYGSAIYAVGKKREKNCFNRNKFNYYRWRYKTVFNLIKFIPDLPITYKKVTFKQFVTQIAVQRKYHINKTGLLKLLLFSLRNHLYVKKEKAGKGKPASHITYYSGWENAGDTVLSKCVRDIFRKFDHGWNLFKISDPVTEDTIHRINNSRYVVIGGGGVLLPDTNPNKISGWQWAISSVDLQKIKVPIIVYAIGYNYFKNQVPTDFFIGNLTRLVNKATFFSLRNSGSIRKIKTLIPKSLHSKIILQPCPTTIIRQLSPWMAPKKYEKKIGINIAFDRYERRYGRQIYSILDQIAMAIKEIHKKGYTIFNVAHLENDLKFQFSLEKQNVPYNSINLQYSLPIEMYNFYNQMDLVLGMRGHAQMIPFGLNTRIISLGTHEKLKYFLEDIESLDWYVDVHKYKNFLKEKIICLFEEINEAKKEETDERLIASQKKIFAITLKNLKHIEKTIGSFIF